jgi:NAD-dependent dihydropyrimidine dehydrogenase PreA subunit
MEEVRAFKDIPGVEWVPAPEPFILIDEARCSGCGNCLRVCLANVFKLRDKKAEVASLDRCMECASCLFVCEPGAIDFRWPNHGTGYRSEWG